MDSVRRVVSVKPIDPQARRIEKVISKGYPLFLAEDLVARQ